MPVAYERPLKGQGPRFKHQTYRGTDTSDPAVAEFPELSRLESRKCGSSYVGLCREPLQSDALRSPALRHKDTNSVQVHESSI
jgi:hypothetical protein